MSYQREYITERAKEKIIPYLKSIGDSCIEYPILSTSGYPQYQYHHNNEDVHILLHRLSYEMYYHETLSPCDVICHKCDNTKCINPLHLFKGTHQDNVKDRVSKNRSACGERNGRWIDGRTSIKKTYTDEDKMSWYGRKVSRECVLKIRGLRNENKKLNEISLLTNIPISTVKDICSGRAYKNIL